MKSKVMDITPTRDICKWCRKPITGLGLEHFVCKSIWVTPHEWVHKDSYTKPTEIEVKNG